MTQDQGPSAALPQSTNRPSSKISRRRRTIFILLSLSLGITAGVMVGEAALRWLDLQPERYEPSRWLVMENGVYRNASNMWGDGLIKKSSRFANQGVVMGEYIPNAEFKVVYSSNPRGYFDADNGVPFKINSLGLRGPEITEKKPPGSYRVLGLGDSFAFGEGVRDEDTFLRRLEKSLNHNARDDRTYEVLNAGTQGYNSRDEVLYLEHRWLKLDPDLILISFYLNDAYADDAFLIRGEGLGIYLTRPQGIARYSYLADWIQHEYAARSIRRAMQTYYSQSYFSQPERSFRSRDGSGVDWHVSRAALEHAVKLAKDRGIEIALVIFPEFQDLNESYPFEAVHDLVKRSCQSFDLPVLDLLETFRGHQERDLWVHPSDHHPNEIAHRMAADAIDHFLQERILDRE